MRPGAIAQSPGREAALAWASLAQRLPASSVLAREGKLSGWPGTPHKHCFDPCSPSIAQFVVLFSVFGFLFFSGPYVLPLQIDGEEKLMKKRDQIHIQDECAMRPLLRLEQGSLQGLGSGSGGPRVVVASSGDKYQLRLLT